MSKNIYIASLVFAIIAAIGLTSWAVANAPVLYAIAVGSICGSHILALITLIKEEPK